MQRHDVGHSKQLGERQPLYRPAIRRGGAGGPQAAGSEHPHAESTADRADSLAQLAMANDGQGPARQFPAWKVEQAKVRAALPCTALE